MVEGWEAWNLDDPAAIRAARRAYPLTPVAARPPGGRSAAAGRPGAVPFLDRGLVTLEELVATLDRTSLRLLHLAKFHHGVTRPDALAEADGCPPDEIDRAARNLAIAGLARRHGDRLEPHPEVVPLLTLSLPLFEDHLLGITSERLGVACRLFGIDAGTTKAARAEALLGVLRDGPRLTAAIDDAGPETAALFARILDLSTRRTGRHRTFTDEPNGAIAIDEVLRGEDRYSFQRSRQVGVNRFGTPRRPHDELLDRLVVGTRPWGAAALWLWFDVLYGLTGRVFPDWPAPPAPDPKPIEASATAATQAVFATRAVVAHLDAQPAAGKKTGDRQVPVRTWRAMAKATQTDPQAVPLLGELATTIGLIFAVDLPQRGRGRNAEFPVQWEPNPARLAEFDALGIGDQWLLLVDAWLDPHGWTPAVIEARTRRRLAVALLASLPEGTGLPRPEFDRLASFRYLCVTGPEDLDDAVAEMAILGLIPPSGPIGLTAPARAAGIGGAAIDAAIGGGATEFVVQPDHSIIAPPDLAARVALELQRYADLESSGGASVWRISSTRLAAASTTTTSDSVLAFFRDHASVPVPDGVARLITDAMRRVSPVTVADVGCVITADDPAVIADAARHKAAKLTVVAPGVAISPLGSAKVAEVLGSKGVVLVGRKVNGDAALPPEVRMAWIGQRDPKAPIGPAAPVALIGPGA